MMMVHRGYDNGEKRSRMADHCLQNGYYNNANGKKEFVIDIVIILNPLIILNNAQYYG